MKTEDLGNFSLFEDLSKEELEKIDGLCDEVSFPDGTFLFREGDPSTYLYLIRTGRVSLRMVLPNERIFAIATMEPGEMVGWSAVRRNKPYTADAVAVGKVSAVRISGEKLDRLFAEDARTGHNITAKLLGVVADRLSEARLRIANIEHG